ncbi:UNVERIFIED_CONTAM: Protein BONZAI 3 [Sesamum indicum]
MGNCFSDVKGGQQAVGSGAQLVVGGAVGDGSATAGTCHNDAVDYFFRAKGEVALFTPIEDPFLRISRAVETGGSIPICKTEVVNNNLNPTWKPLCLTMQQFVSKVEGVEGIMTAYTSALHNVTLAGPTLFGQVIKKAADIAGHSLSCHQAKYYILLIITDGVVSDLQETINSVVRASDLPLSILIVGVGGADFKSMEVLDADNGRRLESSTGRIATRDIVQFVPMREVHGGQISVVQALLEELPSQFLTYVRSRDMKPLNVL